MIYREAYRNGCSRLQDAGIAEAELDARLLLEFVCGTDRNTLLAHGDRELSDEEQSGYDRLLARRVEHVPLQYLTGHQDFMGLDFLVEEGVLIPRQDTEILVEEVLRNLHDGMRILDMCTGSGCILLSLLQYSNACEGVGVDLSGDALRIARRNYERFRAEKPQMHADFVQGNLFEGIRNLPDAEPFDIIVSNPPYIRTDVIETLMPEVREYEPHMALDGTEDGLFYYREIAKEAGAYLVGGGSLYFEIGYDQAQAVRSIMEQEGFREITVIRDYAGLNRVVCGKFRKSDKSLRNGD